MKWKRTATGVVAVAVFAATAFAVSASEPTSATANAAIGPKLPPLPSGPPPTPRSFLSTGTGPTTGVLVTMDGQALYYNDQDVVAVNACAGTCAQVWHPLRPPAGATAAPPAPLPPSVVLPSGVPSGLPSPLIPTPVAPAPANGAMSIGPDVTGVVSIITRADGTMQVTYNGHGLYTYTVDAPGHLTGNGLVDAYGGQAFSWHAATANGVPLPSAAPTPPGLPSPPGLPTPGGSGPPAPIVPTPTPTPTPPLHPTVPA